MPIEDRKALEEAGQEKIEFTSGNSLPEEQLLLDKVANEKTQKEQSIVSLQEDIPNENIEQVSIIQIEEQEVELPTEKIDNSIESERIPELELLNGEMSSTTEELIQDDGQNTSEVEKPQTQKRWKVWKDKIQGFIKKLFA
jgi:hypothetical protein